MANKIGILVDSTADFPKDVAEKLGVRIAPIHVNIDGEDFLDGVTVTNLEVISCLKNGSDVHTSPPTPHEYAEIYDDMLRTYEWVISFHMSSHLSDCYKSAKNSMNLLFDDQQDKIEIIDTGNVSGGQAMIVKKARELILEGVTPGKLYKRLSPFMKNSPMCFTVEDLKWLKRGGRIGTMAAMIGTWLNIKPVIGLIKSELRPVGKYKGKDLAVQGMIKKALEINKQVPGGYEIWVSHIDDPDTGKLMRETLARELHKSIDEIKLVEIGSTIAAHCGPGSCGWAMLPTFK